MARGRVRSRMELREQHEAAEAREEADRKDRGTDEADTADDDSSDAPAKPKKKKKTTGETKPRKKTAKVVRKRVIWVVYDNAHKPIARFPYAQKQEAEAKAEQMKTDKKTTYFVQPLKEEITEE